jgi:hypothetical protein
MFSFYYEERTEARYQELRNHVRPWTIERVRRVNLREGYNPIGLYEPVEVLAL